MQHHCRPSAGMKAPRRAIGFHQPLKVAKKAVIKMDPAMQYKKGDKVYWVNENRCVRLITVESVNPPDDHRIAITAYDENKIYWIWRNELNRLFKTEHGAKRYVKHL